MVFRLRIALLLALVAIFFGARVETQRMHRLSYSGSGRCATECSIVGADNDASPCLTDVPRKMTLVAFHLAEDILPTVPERAFVSARNRYVPDFSAAQTLLDWGLAAGVITQPPDANKKESTVSAACA